MYVRASFCELFHEGEVCQELAVTGTNAISGMTGRPFEEEAGCVAIADPNVAHEISSAADYRTVLPLLIDIAKSTWHEYVPVMTADLKGGFEGDRYVNHWYCASAEREARGDSLVQIHCKPLSVVRLEGAESSQIRIEWPPDRVFMIHMRVGLPPSARGEQTVFSNSESKTWSSVKLPQLAIQNRW